MEIQSLQFTLFRIEFIFFNGSLIILLLLYFSISLCIVEKKRERWMQKWLPQALRWILSWPFRKRFNYFFSSNIWDISYYWPPVVPISSSIAALNYISVLSCRKLLYFMHSLIIYYWFILTLFRTDTDVLPKSRICCFNYLSYRSPCNIPIFAFFIGWNWFYWLMLSIKLHIALLCISSSV
jgi:hypothetical protein